MVALDEQSPDISQGVDQASGELEIFNLKPAGIIAALDLLKPVYRQTAAYGHFGQPQFTWERTDKAEALKAAF